MNNFISFFKRKRRNLVRYFLFSSILLLHFSSSEAQISGRVFKDYNVNGTWDSTSTYLDQGRAGTKVEVFNTKGVLLGSAISNSIGKYSIPNVSGPVRVHFTMPAYYTDGFITKNSTSQSNVRFLNAPATNVDIGINFGDDYCGDNSNMIVACYAIGIGGQSEDAIVTIPYEASGTSPSFKTMMNSPMAFMGCVWGGAYQKESGSFFTASFMKRHAAFGVGGPSAIYVTKNANTPPSATTEIYIKLSDFGIDVGPDPHSAPDYQKDTINPRGNPYDMVGKMSFGDLDITNDGEYIFVSNLWNCKIYRIHVGNPHKPGNQITAADIVEYNVPHPWDEVNVGLARPFGFASRQGKMYVGIICDASISQKKSDLRARVYEMTPDDPANPNWNLLIEFPLDYEKGQATGERPESKFWYPWTNANQSWYSNTLPAFMKEKYISYPMPMLSDIEIDADGSMVVAFMDRFSHQTRLGGPDAYGNTHGIGGFDPRIGGDVLRIGKCNGVWTLESNGSVCGGTPTPGKDNAQGPGGGEFYYGDGNAPLGHNELSVGSLAFRPGSREMILAATDPIGPYSAGLTWLDNETGTKKRSYEILEGLSAILANAPYQFGKAASLGDVNMMCKSSPLEIGNRVWRDDNGNGVQDAGEPGIAGVAMEVVNPNGIVVGRDTTDANGVYAFNHYNVVEPNPKYRVLGLQPFTKYIVKLKGKVVSPAARISKKAKAISGTDYFIMNKTTADSLNNKGALIDGAVLGGTNAGTGPNQDLLDSDGVLDLAAGDAIIPFTTDGIGVSNHTYDFAYCPLPIFNVIATKSTCDPITDKPSANASIMLTDMEFSNRVGYSLGSTYTGPDFTSATLLNGATFYLISDLPNPSVAQIYTIRVYNGDNNCYREVKVTIEPTVCTPCKHTIVASSIVVNNNGTTTNAADDTFTAQIKATAISPGAAGIYEVVLNANPDGTGGTVLNAGGTAYGQTIKVGGGLLSANGQPIKLTIRDKNKPACFETITVQADPFRLNCPTSPVCLPLTTAKK
jgi:SdrD B-like domain